MFSKYKIIVQTSAAAFHPALLARSEANQVQQLARLFASNQNRGDGRVKKPFGSTKTVDECTARPIERPKPAVPFDKSTIKATTYPNNLSAKSKVIPSQQETGKPNMMTECSNPEGPWGPGERKRKPKNYTFGLLLGLALTAGGLYAIYKAGFLDFLGGADGSDNIMRKKVTDVLGGPKIVLKNPLDSTDIPTEIPYLLIGGGTASFSAFRSIKSLDPSAKVLVISSEGNFPYMRPPLSKEIWYNDNQEATKSLRFKQWNGTERSLFYEPNDFYSDCKTLNTNTNGGVAVARGWTVKRLDVNEKKAYLDDGHAIKYDKCLIATGSTPNNLPLFENASKDIQDKISLCREIFDFQKLDNIIKKGAKDIIIIGGGFLGSELACALARRGKHTGLKVHQIFREPGNMGKVLPEYLSVWATDKVKEEGVDVISSATVDDVSLNKNSVILKLSNGENVAADHVIVAIGSKPNTSLACESNLELDPDYGGYLVNAELMARSHLWIAGDCAGFYDPKLGRRRVEHHDHAVVSGRLAGENMTGAGKPYIHQSMFWSDLGPDVGYEAIGIVDASLPTVGVFAKATEKDTPLAIVCATDESNRAATEASAEPYTPPKTKPPSSPQEGDIYDKGVVFYLRNDIVVGVVLWNVFNRMSVARQVLQDERKFKDLNEVAKLFHIHDE